MKTLIHLVGCLLVVSATLILINGKSLPYKEETNDVTISNPLESKTDDGGVITLDKKDEAGCGRNRTANGADDAETLNSQRRRSRRNRQRRVKDDTQEVRQKREAESSTAEPQEVGTQAAGERRRGKGGDRGQNRGRGNGRGNRDGKEPGENGRRNREKEPGENGRRNRENRKSRRGKGDQQEDQPTTPSS